MENSYGIGVANRYALFLDDESDPLETLFQKEQEKELKKKTKVAEKENKVKTEPPKGKIVTSIPKKPNKETTATKVQEKRDGKWPKLAPIVGLFLLFLCITLHNILGFNSYKTLPVL